MSDSGSEKQRALAVRIASQANPAEKEALSRWIEHLLEIKASNLPALQKAKQAISLTASDGVVLPAVKIIAREIKRLGWDDRSVPARLGLGVAAVGLAYFRGQGAGIVALGGGVGVPLWVVFGAGATFLGVLYEVITGTKPNKITSYQVIDAKLIPDSPNNPLPPFRREVSASSAFHEVNFWDLGRVGDLIKRGLPSDIRLNHCGVYKITVPPRYVPRFIHPDKARAAKNVIEPWAVERLMSKWVLNTDIVYIGLAGSRTPRSLRKRLDDLLKHASGRTTDRGPHRGGEIVWQLHDYHEFHLWAAQTSDPPIPREIEETLLRQFRDAHRTLPFANRKL
jgi:hypothetical protein